MPRPKKCRHVWDEPGIDYFKPVGKRLIDLESIDLAIDEYEALRLNDKEEMTQKQAAEKMNISQPTFHRTLKNARHKVARALVEGKAIKIHGGEYKMRRGFGKPPSTCKCPNCANTQSKIRGQPCQRTKCQKCGTMMVRGD